jgi:hypothetical protein
MENLGDGQVSPSDNDEGLIATRELDRFVALLPELYYAVNRVLEDCTPQFSKKVGVALWALGGSAKVDDVGQYLITSDLVKTFRDWFVVSPESANSQVSKVKTDLFGLQFIKIEGDRDHIHLTPRGEEAVHQMHLVARKVLRQTLVALTEQERGVLLDFAQRMIATKKPPTKESGPSSPGRSEVG